MSKVKYHMSWIVGTQEDAVKAIAEIIENGNVVSSLGAGEEQYEGLEANEGTFTIAPHEGKVMLSWVSVVQDGIEDYWMSPYCFETVETFGDGMKDNGGEANNFYTQTMEV
jgi:hypothetical protein